MRYDLNEEHALPVPGSSQGNVQHFLVPLRFSLAAVTKTGFVKVRINTPTHSKLHSFPVRPALRRADRAGAGLPRVMLRRPDAVRLAGAVLGLVVQCAAGQFPAPAFTDKTFAPGVDHRNNWCEASNAVLNGTIVTADALRGRNISVSWPAVENYSPKGFHVTDDTGALTDQGLMVEIMDELASRAGFSWRNSYHFFQPPQESSTYSWTEYASFCVLSRMRSLSSPVLSLPLPSLPCCPPSPVSALFLSLPLDLLHAHAPALCAVQPHVTCQRYSFLCFPLLSKPCQRYSCICLCVCVWTCNACSFLFNVCAIIDPRLLLAPPRACLVWTCSCIVLSTSAFDYFFGLFPSQHMQLSCVDYKRI